MKKRTVFGICTCLLIGGLAQAVDNSGRNSHFTPECLVENNGSVQDSE